MSGKGPINLKNVILAGLALICLIAVGFGVKEVLFKNGDDGGKSPLITEMLLPIVAEPEHYDLMLKAFLPGYESHIPPEKNLTFDAKLVIHLLVKEPVKVITVNSKYLQFHLSKCRFDTESGLHVNIVKNETSDTLEKTEFHLEKTVPKGRHRITIFYSGSINNHLTGFYQTTYTTAEGVQRDLDPQFRIMDYSE